MFKKKNKQKSKLIRCPKCKQTFTQKEVVQEGRYGNDWIDLCPYCDAYLGD